MKTSILLWSSVSGLVLGLFIDATLIGVALLFWGVWPTLANRMVNRYTVALAVVVLVAVLVGSVALGFLEGRLKLE